MKINKTSMQGLPYVPLDPNWICESTAFLSEDPKVVRALMRLIIRAWQSVPAGSVPADFRSVASITGLSEIDVGEHYEDLFSGWLLKEGRMHHILMSGLCDRISVKFKDSFDSLLDQSAAIIQSPEDFVLSSPVVESSRKGKKLIPKSWKVSPELRVWATQNGYATESDIDFIEVKFTSYYGSKAVMMADFDLAFKNFALREDRTRLPSALVATPAFGAGSRSSRFGSAGSSSLAHNESVFSASRERRAENVQ